MMTMHRFTHLKPSGLEEALNILKEKGEKTKIVAGGSDLLVHLKRKTAAPEFVLDIKDLAQLKGIAAGPGGKLSIGALTTLSELSRSPEVRKDFPILAQAAGKVASVQIRNAATLGGNICLDTRCWYYNQSAQWRKSVARCYKTGGDRCHVIKNSDKCNAVFLADTVPALLALDAELRILLPGGERIIPVGEFYNGSGEPANLLAPDEILAGVLLPGAPAGSFSAFFKDAPREVVDFALVNMALVIAFKEGSNACADARVVLGGVNSYPVRAGSAEAALQGREITPALAEEVAELTVKDAAPISPIWVTPAQRRATIKHFVRKGLLAAVAGR